MDITLVQPKYKLGRELSRRAPLPLGLLSVATPLDVNGHRVRIIDQQTEPDWEGELVAELRKKPICVGITSMTGPQIWWALKAAEIVKREGEIPVVWGGVHASLLPHQTLENPLIDVIVQGEGEETFLELVNTMAAGKPLTTVKGIWYKEGKHIKQNPPRPFIDLNQQPQLSYHLIDLKKFMISLSGRDGLKIESSRGCPFSCAFCYNTCFNRRIWRAVTPEQTLLRIKKIIDEHHLEAIAFSDDNFFTDLERARQILEGIVRQQLNITWGMGDIRLDLLAKLDNDYMRLLEKSGCHSLIIGVESGSQRIADLLRKQIEVSEAVSVNRRLLNYNIQPRYLFLIGIPGETEDDLLKTASLMVRLVEENPKASVDATIFVPYPGTELFDLAVQNGLSVPQELAGWIPFSWTERKLEHSWLSAERKKLLRMLSFCGNFITEGSSSMFLEVSPLVTLARKLYRPVARRRVKGLHYTFLPEIKMAELIGFRGD